MIAMMSRGVAPSALSARTTESSVVPAWVHELRTVLVHIHLFVRHHLRRAALRKRGRLRHVELRADLHRQAAVCDGCRTDANLAANHHRAGSLVDHDAGGGVGFDRQHFEARHQPAMFEQYWSGTFDRDAAGSTTDARSSPSDSLTASATCAALTKSGSRSAA